MSAQPLGNDAMTLDVPAPGTVLARAYRVDGVLATGGMGVVLRATEMASQRAVAVKVMAAAAAADPEQVARFRREAKAASSLTSKHVVRVLDFGELESGLPFLVMEHLDGTSLADLLKARGALPIREAVGYVLQAIHGVAEAHALGIVHRDLKPANLFVTGEDGERVIKVLDFGASKLTAESTVDPSDPGGVTVASSLIGSPRYMAPEQIRSALEVDARADVYALGATLHELLSGKPIFFADSLARIFAQVLWDAPEALSATRDDVPAALAEIVSRCLAKAPGDRFATALALAVALAPFGPSRSEELPAPKPAAAAKLPQPPLPKPSPVSGSKLVAARLFKPDEPAPKTRKPISATRAAVVLKSTAKMQRVKMASEAPKRTVKIAAFALAARLTSGVIAVPSPAADAIARGARTAKMARFAARGVDVSSPPASRAPRTKVAPNTRSALVLVLALLALALVASAAAAGIARYRAHAGVGPARARGTHVTTPLVK